MKENELLSNLISNEKCPKHVAIIMDGNGRWAKSKGMLRTFGHNEGVNSVRDIIDASIEVGIEHLTLYTFSTENWNRPKWEVTALMKLLVYTLNQEFKHLMDKNVKVNMLGREEDLPKEVLSSFSKTISDTKKNTGMQLNIAMSYSSRTEIVHAAKEIAKKVKEGSLDPDEIDEHYFSSNLYTANIPDPDLLIRTSGEFRISNFLLWQIAYTEIYITDTLWPEFRKMEYLEAIFSFTQRERRYGKVSEQLKDKS